MTRQEFEDLVASHYNDLVQLAKRIARSRGLPNKDYEDALHRTVLEVIHRGTHSRRPANWSQARPWFARAIKNSILMMQREWCTQRGIPKLKYPYTDNQESIVEACIEDWLGLEDARWHGHMRDEVNEIPTFSMDRVRRTRKRPFPWDKCLRPPYRVLLRHAIERALRDFTEADCLAIRDRLLVGMEFEELATAHPARSASGWTQWFNFSAILQLRKCLWDYRRGGPARPAVPGIPS